MRNGDIRSCDDDDDDVDDDNDYNHNDNTKNLDNWKYSLEDNHKDNHRDKNNTYI